MLGPVNKPLELPHVPINSVITRLAIDPGNQYCDVNPGWSRHTNAPLVLCAVRVITNVPLVLDSDIFVFLYLLKGNGLKLVE